MPYKPLIYKNISRFEIYCGWSHQLPNYKDSAIFPVQKEDRVLRGVDLALLWAGSAVAVDVWYSGGYLADVGWIAGIAMIVAGSIVGSLIFAAAGLIGSYAGIPSMVSVRGSFGIRGSYLMSFLNYLTLVGWTAWMININASAADAVGRLTFGWEGFGYWIIICGIACTLLALFRAEGWKWFSRATVVALVVMAAAINVVLFSNYSWNFLAAIPGGGMHLSVAFDLALIIPLSWAPLAADYMRFSRSPKGGFFGSFIGQSSVNAWFYATGLACALAFGMLDPTVYVTMVAGISFGIVALFVIWLGTITTTFLDIYSANISLINVMPNLKEWQGTLMTGGAGTLIALLPWLGVFVDFLYVIGAVFVPMFAIVIADYFIVNKRGYSVTELYDPRGRYWFSHGFNLCSMVVWGIGIAIYFFIQSFAPSLGMTLPCFLSTFLIYLLVKKAF